MVLEHLDVFEDVSLLGHLADCFVLELGRISLLAHGTPPAASMLASEVSTRPGQFQLYKWFAPQVQREVPTPPALHLDSTRTPGVS